MCIDKNNFMVKVTKENREIVSKWWYSLWPDDRRGFDLDCHFGKKKGERLGRASGYGTEGMPVIPYEDFLRYIVNGEELPYEIY